MLSICKTMFRQECDQCRRVVYPGEYVGLRTILKATGETIRAVDTIPLRGDEFSVLTICKNCLENDDR